MNKTFIKALITGIMFVFVFYAFQMIRREYFSPNDVPDIISSYASVDYLQQETKYGSISSPMWRVIESLGLMLLGVAVFYVGRLLRRKK
ncbi:hypothetical protein [Cohnella abietis]|uniref:Uncharacterized protein n=1 Tax=Cohnella abietis TaxID=2507935 RepID=A0A3T1DBK3_9BACL|nr:hypothetical protein [Cohnella abietis]BBI35473.1 hypothetical protein KCTCHS21_48720 [Cohnella abietis]